MPLVKTISATYNLLKEKVSQSITARFKSRDVRVLPDPSLQNRTPHPGSPPVPTTPAVDRKVTPSGSSRPSKLPKKKRLRRPPPAKVTPRLVSNPLRTFGLNENVGRSKALSHISEQFSEELKEIHQKATEEHNDLLAKDIDELHQGLRDTPLEEFVTQLKEFPLPLFSQYQAAFEFLLQLPPQAPPPELPPSPGPEDEKIEQKKPAPFSETETHARPLQSFHNGRLNLMVGNIAKIQTSHHFPVEAVICPAGGMKNSTASKQIMAAEPKLAAPEFQQALSQQQSGFSGVVPASGLEEQGVKHIILPFTPKAGDEDPQTLLLKSYVSAIFQAIDKGADSLAIPIISDPAIGISGNEACKLALQAVLYSQKETKNGKIPKIYFVLPDTHEAKSLNELMQAEIKALPAPIDPGTDEVSKDLAQLNLREQEALRLLGKFLPKGTHFTFSTRQRIKWMNSEIRRLCGLMYKGHCLPGDYEKMHQYLHTASKTMLALADKGDISPHEMELLNEYLENKIEILEIYQRKQEKQILSRLRLKNPEQYYSTSRLHTCPPHVKVAYVEGFDSFCAPVFQQYRSGLPGPSASNAAISTSRKAVWVKALIHLYQKHGDAEAMQIREEDIPLIQMAAIYDDLPQSSNQKTNNAVACKAVMIKNSVDEETASEIASAISARNTTEDDKGILEKILNDARLLEQMQTQEQFDIASLSFTRQFSSLQHAMKDVETMSEDVAKIIHQQQPLKKPTTLLHGQIELSTIPAVADEPQQRARLEHTEHTYSAVEADIERQNNFLSVLLIDS